MKTRIFILSISLFCATEICLSQSSIVSSDSTMFKSDFNIGFGSYYQFSSFGRTNLNTASFPESIGRRLGDSDVRRNWNLNGDKITDNPFFHGSYFLKIGGNFDFGPNFNITGAIIGEQRGFSDGIFSDRTRNMYTYIHRIQKAKRFGRYLFTRC